MPDEPHDPRTPAPDDPPTPAPPRSPRDYRPDLRPMVILATLLVAVVLGWIVLSPMILPR